ncbi:MAG: histidine phosphatase family protein [Actinomycetota bacterium]
MAATLTLLRHGRTTANAGGMLQGRIDNPLDEVGERQAVAAADALGQVDRVIASPLMRAQQTATAFGMEIETDERWIELDYGEWDGRPLRDVPPETWARWRTDLSLRPPGGETLHELGDRVRAALAELAAEASGHVVVVSHVSPIKAAVAWGLGVGDEVSWRTRLTTGSYSQLDLGGPSLVAFNIVPVLS